MNFDGIPTELRERDQWLLWDESADTPRRPHWRGDFGISWSDPDDWHTFEDVVDAAKERESWGIGYVMAAEIEDEPTGVHACIDIDGGLTESGELKDWVPDLAAFTDAATYIEKSPSGTGLHIPIYAQHLPEWWTDGQLADHEGVDVLAGKFCTFTGDVIDQSGSGIANIDPTAWLYDAYQAIHDEGPRVESTTNGDYDGGDDLDEADVKEALEHVDSKLSYQDWLRVGMAVYDWNGGARGKSLFEQWSKTNPKWDASRGQRHIDDIFDNDSPNGDVSVGTLIHHAKEGEWEPSWDNDNEPDVTGADTVEETEHNDTEQSDGELLADLKAEVILPYRDPEDYDGETIDQNVAIDRAARVFDKYLDFVRPREITRGWRDCLYMYVDGEHIGSEDAAGIYEPNAKAEIERIAESHFYGMANDAFIRELTNKIERRNRVRAKKLEPDPERLAVKNGILDLTTGEVDPHTPEEYHRTKVDVDYNADAECERIDEFLHSVVEDDKVDTLYRFIAHTLYKGYPESKAAMLLGDGANGKSMFLALVEEFLGEFNVSGRSLQDITEYRWAANDLVGKLANIHADMSDQDVDSMRMFKNLTGGDTVDADVKFEKPVKFTNHATMMFACNDMPVLRDDTQGNWRRWALINFPHTFDSDDPAAKDAKPRDQLLREITDEKELQGLLARCVEEIKAWDDGRAWFPDVAGWRETRSKMRRAAEPVFDFAEACLINADGEHAEKSDVREAYRRYATKQGLPKLDREEFGRKLLMLSDYDVESSQIRSDDGPERIMVYKNIQLNNRAKSLIGQSEGVDAKEAVMQTVRNNGDRLPEAMVIDVLETEYGIDNGRAQHALDKLKEQGRLIPSTEHGTSWVSTP